MRIAHVTATFPPYRAGTGHVAFHNARLLYERGHDVHVFSAGSGAETTAFPFPVERLPAPIRLGNAPFTPGLLVRLRGFDVIHVHHPYIFGAELATLAARLRATPLVLTYHNRLEESVPLKRALFAAYNRAIEPALLRSARFVLAVRRTHLISVHPFLARSERVRELVNGVDGSTFEPVPADRARAGLGLPGRTPTVLFVGALDRAHRFKNVDGLLRAFARVTEPDAHLLIVGDGGLRPSLERLAATLGIARRVRFLGTMAPEALPSVYGAADVTVLPSTGVESFGMVLVESLACGTPVVATDLPGVRDLLADGGAGTGVLADAADPSALASALGSALRARATLRERALARRGALLATYDWAVVGGRLETLYREALVPVQRAVTA